MTLNANLLNAVIAMDAYNRGYNAGIENLGGLGSQLGNLTFISDTRILEDSSNNRLDQLTGFYGASYILDDNNNGVRDNNEQTFISFRGTDDEGNMDLGVSLADIATALIRPNIPESLVLLAKIANNADINITPDIINGWTMGLGFDQSVQAILAHEFYKDVVGGFDNVLTANVTLTGHSMGGGLAGLVAANDNHHRQERLSA